MPLDCSAYSTLPLCYLIDAAKFDLVSKVKLIILTLSTQALPIAFLISVDDYPIMPVAQVKKLGVLLDSSLLSHTHVQSIRKSLGSTFPIYPESSHSTLSPPFLLRSEPTSPWLYYGSSLLTGFPASPLPPSCRPHHPSTQKWAAGSRFYSEWKIKSSQ